MRRRLLVGVLFFVAIGCASLDAIRPPPPVPPAVSAPLPAAAAHAPSPVVPGFDCAEIDAKPLACRPDEPRSWDRTSGVLARQDELMTRIACAPPKAPHARGASWNRRDDPHGLDAVVRRYGLTKKEREQLFRDGFVVPARLAFEDYALALQDVYRSELPVYVSIDAILHAIYASNDKAIALVETSALEPELHRILEAMHAKLAAAPGRYTKETANDLDLYLTVARKLYDDAARSAFGQEAEASDLVRRVQAARGLEEVPMFGRRRVVDFGQFRPRGHYAPGAAKRNPAEADLSSFFRVATWLSRIEMNLVSRSSRSSSPTLDPSETPREAHLAIAIADLARQARVQDELARVNRAWGMLAGPREDVSPEDIEQLVAAAKIADPASPDAPAALRSAIGDRFVRTARTHFQYEGTKELPVIATMLGPRIPPDAAITRPLVHAETPNRFEATMIDVAFALGHDRALAYEQRDLAVFPGLAQALAKARADVAASRERPDLYTAWLTAIRGLAEKPAGVVPSFMETAAFEDMRINSTVAAYGQIRHDYVLMVPLTYDEGGCDIPDGWVEPAPATYRALVDYADRAVEALRPFGEGQERFFVRMGRILRVLARISESELAGQPLTDEEKLFLAGVSKLAYRESRYSYPGQVHKGWYYDLFVQEDDALAGARLVGDYFVSTNTHVTRYAGVSEVRLGVFVVDTGGGPRVFVGPVSRAFQARGPISPRYDDEDVGRFPVEDPWAKSYTVEAATIPRFTIRILDENALEVVASSNLGTVTIALTDHHSVPIATSTREVLGPSRVRFTFDNPVYSDPTVFHFGPEGIRVQVGDYVQSVHLGTELLVTKEVHVGGPITPVKVPTPKSIHVTGRAKRL